MHGEVGVFLAHQPLRQSTVSHFWTVVPPTASMVSQSKSNPPHVIRGVVNSIVCPGKARLSLSQQSSELTA